MVGEAELTLGTNPMLATFLPPTAEVESLFVVRYAETGSVWV